MNEYFDDNTEKLLKVFQDLGDSFNPENIRFLKNSCLENNKSYVYNFYSMFEQVHVRNILVSKPEILNQLLRDKFIEIANFLITETNFTYEELETFEDWRNLNLEDKCYIKYCINYKVDILKAISTCNYESFVRYYEDIDYFPRPSSLLKLIMNRIVKRDGEEFKILYHFLKSEKTKGLYPNALLDTLILAAFKSREDMIKYLIFDYKIERTSQIDILIEEEKEINLKAMFDSRDLYDSLKELKTKDNKEDSSRGKGKI